MKNNKQAPQFKKSIIKSRVSNNGLVQNKIIRNGTKNQKPDDRTNSVSAAKSGSQLISSLKTVGFRPVAKPIRSSESSGSSGLSRHLAAQQKQ